MLFFPTVRLIYEGSWSGGYVEPARRLYDNELVYVSRGQFHFDLEGRSHLLTRGAVVLIPPGVWHESRTAPNTCVTRHCVHFDWLPMPFPSSRPLAAYVGDVYDPEWISPVPAEIREVLPLLDRVASRREITEMIMLMFRYFRQRHDLGETMLWPVLRALLAGKAEAPASMLPSSGKGSRRSLIVRDYIDRHYAEPQDYATYCQLVKTSPSHLCRTFAAQIGRTPQAYLNDVRMHHACRLLQEGVLNVNEVGRAVGIPDANYFSRLFRRQFGKSPSRFLEQRYALSGPAGK